LTREDTVGNELKAECPTGDQNGDASDPCREELTT
jgi:hypothetical protein